MNLYGDMKERAERHHDSWTVAVADASVGRVVLQFAGDLTGALTHIRRAQQRFEEIGAGRLVHDQFRQPLSPD